MLELILLGVIAGTTLYGQKVRSMLKGSDIDTLRISHPGTATALAQERNLTKQLRDMPKYDLGVPLEDEDYTKVRAIEEPDVVNIYRKFDPTFQYQGMENPYRKLLSMRLKKDER